MGEPGWSTIDVGWSVRIQVKKGAKAVPHPGRDHRNCLAAAENRRGCIFFAIFEPDFPSVVPW